MTINTLVASVLACNENSIERIRSVINWPNSYVNFIDHACNDLVGRWKSGRDTEPRCELRDLSGEVKVLATDAH